ncbi:uncharacterized protein LOC112683722 isoform X2 [Sipha flava]|uniref:Uncharacterized protein LOC112683722 isoform X2 n=1 Tax=Sipha flava TaxID=143950 RepID=A0A8B8FID2_9HEMI|nr:uncharacterized protein LOC112683722 isoform X2 [Sipha flava]
MKTRHILQIYRLEQKTNMETVERGEASAREIAGSTADGQKDGRRRQVDGGFPSWAVDVLRNVTVEPLLGVFQLSMILSSLTTQNLNLQKACRVNMALDEATCGALRGNRNGTFYRDEEIGAQQLVAGMMVWQNVIQNAVPCALVVFIGSWSDRHCRRKPFMLMPILGELVRNVGLIVCVFYFYELPMEVAGLVESVPSSVTGSLPVLFLAVFAYVGDISTVENRTLRVGFVTLFSSISVPIGAALSGILFREYGFYGVYIISTVLYLITFVYGIIVISDVKPAIDENGDKPVVVTKQTGKSSSLCNIVEFFDLIHVKKAIWVTFKQGDDNRRTNIILLMVIVVILLGPLSGEQSLMYLLTRVKFNWNEVDYSLFSTYYFICNLIGIGFTLCVLVNRFGVDDRLIGAIGCLSKGLAAFVYAFAPTGFVFYVGPIVDIFHGTAFVAMRSILSKLVPANELGQVLAVFSLAETVVPAIFRPLYSVIYQKTLNWFPGAFYIFGGTINLPGVLIFLWMYFEKSKKQEFTEEKQALSTEVDSHHNTKIYKNY